MDWLNEVIRDVQKAQRMIDDARMNHKQIASQLHNLADLCNSLELIDWSNEGLDLMDETADLCSGLQDVLVEVVEGFDTVDKLKSDDVICSELHEVLGKVISNPCYHRSGDHSINEITADVGEHEFHKINISLVKHVSAGVVQLGRPERIDESCIQDVFYWQGNSLMLDSFSKLIELTTTSSNLLECDPFWLATIDSATKAWERLSLKNLFSTCKSVFDSMADQYLEFLLKDGHIFLEQMVRA